MLSVSQLKAFFKQWDARAKKRLGQNFLTDKRYLEKIITSCDITKEDIVVEIGPGLAALTEGLGRLCRKLIAVEIDRGLYAFLEGLFKDKNNIEVVLSDILKFDFKDISEKFKTKIKVVGNLPFYITSPIITYLIDNRQYIESVFITVQKEVAQRLVSSPAKKSYGSLSCFVQFYTKPNIMFSIPKEAFYPMPKVESAFVKLEFLKTPPVKVKDEELFFKIINAAFNKRRKTLLNALSISAILEISKEPLGEILSDLRIDPNRRGETLSLQEFAALAQKLEAFYGR